MPSMQFQPMLREIRDILGADFYFIPRFQRPFSWTDENIEDFWRDTVRDNDAGYFIGPMVAYEAHKSHFGMVDGQQRLTTIMLTIAALRDLFLELDESSSVRGIGKYIARSDDEDRQHFVLKTLAAEEYFKSQILKNPPRKSTPTTRVEERELQKAFASIKHKLEEEIDDLERKHADDTPSPAALRLREIRDKILSLKIIWIRLDNEDDAYSIFETLNSRGKDLEVVDLLKNYLLQSIRAVNADLDEARVTWEDVRRTLERAGGTNPNKYILHWWLSRYDYTAERKLFAEIKKRTGKAEAPRLLDELHRDAEFYARIAHPSSWECRADQFDARDSLLALDMFGVRQPRPMLLSLMRAYSSGEIRLARLTKALRTIENFHYQSTAIVGVSSTGGISEMYAKHARELSNAKNQIQRDAAIDGLLAKLKSSQRLPARETFISEFDRTLRFSERETANKRLVQYTLRKLHEAVRSGHAIDHTKCNIEHISAQSAAEDYMASIGNLLWIERGLNSKLGNKPYSEKRAILIPDYAATYDLTEVAEEADWGSDQVEARALRLATLAVDKVWRL